MNHFKRYFIAFYLLIAVTPFLFAVDPTPLHFQGRFVGLLCERLQDGRFEVHDQLIDGNLSVDFTINNEAAPSQLASTHRWAGKSKNGILSNVRLAQAGQIHVSLADGSVRFQGTLNLNVNNRDIALPYSVSTDSPSLPAGLPFGIGARKLQYTEQNKAANIALVGVTNLDGDAAAAFRTLLQNAGQKVGEGQLLFITGFDGRITRVAQ